MLLLPLLLLGFAPDKPGWCVLLCHYILGIIQSHLELGCSTLELFRETGEGQHRDAFAIFIEAYGGEAP